MEIAENPAVGIEETFSRGFNYFRRINFRELIPIFGTAFQPN
jgi:hypothetical protein